MENKKFLSYVLLTSLGFLAAILVGLFMFTQFRSNMENYNKLTKNILQEQVLQLTTSILSNTTGFLEEQYPVLKDTELLKNEAGSDWFWEMSEEWRRLAAVYGFAYIYYIEKNNGNYIFLVSSDILRGRQPELLGTAVWAGAAPDFIEEAWETGELTISPSLTVNEWGTLLTAARPVISGGKVRGILGISYNIEFLDRYLQDELVLEEQEKNLLQRMRLILIVSTILIIIFMGYQIWLSTTSVIVPLRKLEADERTRIMLDATPMLCSLWDTDGNLIDCNKKAVDLFGCKNKEDFLENFYSLSPEYQPDGMRSSEKINLLIKNSLQKGPNVLAWEHIKTDGTPLPMELTIQPVSWKNTYRVIVWARDLSKLFETEDNLNRVLAITESSPNFILSMGSGGNIEYMNPAIQNITGISADELAKNGLSMILNPLDYGLLSGEYIPAALKNKSVNFEIPLITKTEGIRDFYFSAFMVPMRHGNTGIGFLGRDITERKRMELELAAAKEQAERALASEISYNKAKSDFLSRVSHELRTPLNVIIGITNIAEKTRKEIDTEENYLKIRNSSENLLGLVNDILDMTGLETGKFDFTPRPFSLGKTILSIIETIRQKIQAKNQVLLTDINIGTHDQVTGDERRLKQVLLNLLNNAVKFSPRNGTIQFNAGIIESSADECRVQFDIIDNGIGIAPRLLEHLGEIFEQADNSITREYSGMGLGLSLTKRIVELMKGSIKVESELGKGSHFCCDVCLDLLPRPAAEETPEPDAEITVPETEIPMVNLAGKRVLVVDDVDINREILIALLSETGASFDEAQDGDEAVKIFSRNKYDLILMDLHMPVMDGFTAAKIIRSSPLVWAKTIPIISVSAENSRECHEKCLEAGINDYIIKPIETEVLFKIISKWMIHWN